MDRPRIHRWNAEYYQWSVDGHPSPLGTRDVQAMLTHEIGHALGLLHNCDEEAGACTPSEAAAVMYPSYRGEAQRVLERDDIDGLCFLYDR